MIGVAPVDVAADVDIGVPLASRCLMLGDASTALTAATVTVVEEDALRPDISHGVGAAVLLQEVAPVLTVDHGRVVLGAQ